MQPSRLIFIELSRVHRLLREMPSFLSVLLKQATRDLSALEDKYLQMATRQAHVRLASLLLSFKQANENGAERSDCKFELPLMNKDIADLIGIRPETLSRAIGQLRSAGLAEMRDHMVHIPSIAKLARLGGCTPQPAFAA
jgi:CRP-like cAMP-binding protein